MSSIESANPAGVIEFWFEYGSCYAYLSAMRIDEAAKKHGVTVLWRPFFLGALLHELKVPPAFEMTAKREYMLTDMARQCGRMGIPWVRPSHFPRLGLLPLRIAALGMREPWLPAFSKDVMVLNFALDRDINLEDHLAPLLRIRGLNPTEWLDAANSAEGKECLRKQTDLARDRGVFGAPTFFIGNEMFWGNDRMADALEAAQKTEVALKPSGSCNQALSLRPFDVRPT